MHGDDDTLGVGAAKPVGRKICAVRGHKVHRFMGQRSEGVSRFFGFLEQGGIGHAPGDPPPGRSGMGRELSVNGHSGHVGGAAAPGGVCQQQNARQGGERERM